MNDLKIEVLDERLHLFLPTYATEGSAAVDLRACIPEKIKIKPGAKVKIPAGFAAEIPEGYAGVIVPRSGLGSQGLNLANGTGIIDSDYRGEIIVMLRHVGVTPNVSVGGRGDKEVVINPLDRIAQMLIIPVAKMKIQVVNKLSETGRGAGGFSSTGIA